MPLLLPDLLITIAAMITDKPQPKKAQSWNAEWMAWGHGWNGRYGWYGHGRNGHDVALM